MYPTVYAFMFHLLMLVAGPDQPAHRAFQPPASLLANDVMLFLDSIGFRSSDPFVFIDKSGYRLYLMQDTFLLKEYAVVFGSNPIDDKRMEGDGCTPDGIFRVRDLYPHRNWNYFIWIDYPNKDSWKKFRAAKQNGAIPANASIGGEIGIHGVPDGRDELLDARINWTLGCVSMKNADVAEVYQSLKKGSTVIIRP